MTDTSLSPEEQLIEDIAGFTHDPLGYALYAFPWGKRVQSWRMHPDQETGKDGCSIRLVSTSGTQKPVISR